MQPVQPVSTTWPDAGPPDARPPTINNSNASMFYSEGCHEANNDDITMDDDYELLHDTHLYEQVGGGRGSPIPADQSSTIKRFGLRCNITLTPNAQKCHHFRNAAGEPPKETLPIAPADSEDVFFNGLDDALIASMAHDNTSPFLSTSSMPSPASAGALSPDKAGILAHTLFADFLKVGEFEPVTLPSGPKEFRHLSDAPAPESAANPPSHSDVATSNAVTPVTPPHPISQTLRSFSSHRGRISNAEYAQLKKGFNEIDKLLERIAQDLGRPVDMIRRRYLNSRAPRLLRSETVWNLYQSYFSIHRDEEMSRPNVGTSDNHDFNEIIRDCFKAFMAEHGKEAEDFLRTANDLDRVTNERETVQQRTRMFEKHMQRVERLNNEAVNNRFQSVTIVVGECVNEDACLSAISATSGLENFFPNRLKLDNHIVTGLLKCEAYNGVAERFTKQYDAEGIAKGLKTCSKAIPAEVDLNSTKPESDVDDSELDEANPIEGCKKQLLKLLVAAGKAVGVPYNSKKVPWTTLGKHLVASSHVVEGWPAACPFPAETVKGEKSKRANGTDGSQGIKDLGMKYGRILLMALKNKEIKLVFHDAEDILNNSVPIITTAPSRSSDEAHSKVRCLYHDGHTAYIEAKKSAAVTQAKRKKKAPIIPVSSTSLSSSSPSPAPAKKVKTWPSKSTAVKKCQKGATSVEATELQSDDNYTSADDDIESESGWNYSPMKTQAAKKGKGKERVTTAAPTEKRTVSSITTRDWSAPPPKKKISVATRAKSAVSTLKETSSIPVAASQVNVTAIPTIKKPTTTTSATNAAASIISQEKMPGATMAQEKTAVEKEKKAAPEKPAALTSVKEIPMTEKLASKSVASHARSTSVNRSPIETKTKPAPSAVSNTVIATQSGLPSQALGNRPAPDTANAHRKPQTGQDVLDSLLSSRPPATRANLKISAVPEPVSHGVTLATVMSPPTNAERYHQEDLPRSTTNQEVAMKQPHKKSPSHDRCDPPDSNSRAPSESEPQIERANAHRDPPDSNFRAPSEPQHERANAKSWPYQNEPYDTRPPGHYDFYNPYNQPHHQPQPAYSNYAPYYDPSYRLPHNYPGGPGAPHLHPPPQFPAGGHPAYAAHGRPYHHQGEQPLQFYGPPHHAQPSGMVPPPQTPLQYGLSHQNGQPPFSSFEAQYWGQQGQPPAKSHNELNTNMEG